MNILITGGAGYIGNVLIRTLLKIKKINKITIIDKFFFKQEKTLESLKNEKRLVIIKDNIKNEKLLKKEIKSNDVIIPLAAVVGAPACEKYPELAEEVNFNQIKNITDIADNNQLIIMPVTNSGYGIGGENFCDETSPLRPISLYGKTKVRAEEYLITNYNNYVSLRLATVFGVSERMRVDLLVNDFVYKSFFDEKLVLFEANFRRNFIHIQDVANLIANISIDNSKYKNQTFNVGLEEANLTKLELAKKIQKHIKELKIEINEFASDPDKRDYIVSNKKLLATGWKTNYTLDYGIKELINYFKTNKKYYSNV
tara:strand:- start:3547 stop:4485 length:939 start_codon:yes stop_codon:yes gene_type:complete